MSKVQKSTDKPVTSLQNSISFKLNIVLAATILIIMTGWGVYFFFSEKAKIHRQLELSVEQFTVRIARQTPFSVQTIRDNLYDAIDGRDVQGIALTYKAGNREEFLGLVKNGKTSEYSDRKLFDGGARGIDRFGPLVFKRNVVIDGKPAASVELFFTDKFINKELMVFIVRLAALTAIMSLIVLAILYFSLRRIIVKPIEDLDRVVRKFTEKDFSVRALIGTEDEVGALGRNFNTMADSIEVYRQEITRQLFIDSLTGLPNRNKILVDIEQTVDPSLVLMNVDSFKEINDFYGNKIGDEVLKEISNRLKHYEKEIGYQLYRMNGDEYALLFDKGMAAADMEKFVRNLGSEINEKPFVVNDNDISVRLTTGIALGQDMKSQGLAEGKWTRLATNADMALKKAKKKQKDYVIYDDSIEIPKEYESNIFWRQRLREAIKDHKIVPFFQPIINNYNGRIEKYESLVRLIDPYGNVITPGYFLDVAKRAHLYSDITKAMIEKAFPTFYGTNYEFSINLTLFDILDDDVNRFIMRKLKDNPDLAKMLVFEILESEGIENYREVMIFIEEVKDIGCKIAIDDFGSGYSNFEHILRLDVDYIKIDSSLIKNLDKDVNAQIITRTIANFARKLGLKTISEYVHSKEVYEKAVGLGVDFSQGFYFGEPKEFILKPKDYIINPAKTKPGEKEI